MAAAVFLHKAVSSGELESEGSGRLLKKQSIKTPFLITSSEVNLRSRRVCTTEPHRTSIDGEQCGDEAPRLKLISTEDTEDTVAAVVSKCQNL